MKKQIIIIVVAALVIGGVVFAIGSKKPSTHIPQEFIDARAASAKAAEQISTLISDSLGNLAAVATRERQKDYAGAKKIVADELKKNGEKQDAAAILASETEKMARAIATVEPQEARQFALEAVSDQVAIVSHVVIYEEFLGQLFTVLSKLPSNAAQVDGLLDRINNEAAVINSLNVQFHASLVKFDEAVK